MSYYDDDDSTVDGTISPNYRAHVRQQAVNGGDGYGHVDEQDETAMYRQLQRNADYGGGGGGGRRQADLEDELEQLRQMIATTSQGTVEGKYLEQMRKNRELNVRYESEKARANKLAKRVVDLEREKMQEQQEAKKGILLPSQRPGVSSAPGGQKPPPEEQELAEAKTKLSTATKSLASLRKQNTELKAELSKMKRVVSIEVGDENLVEKALEAASELGTPTKRTISSNDNTGAATGWRGRAQQITLLKSKCKELERQVANSTIIGSNAGMDVTNPDDFNTGAAGGPDVETMTNATMRTNMSTVTATTRRDVDELSRLTLAKKQNNLRSEAKELAKQVQMKDEQIEKEKHRADAVAARLANLERDNTHLKNCIQRIIEKTENDDKLIETYKQELDDVRRESRQALMSQSQGKRSGVPSGPNNQALESENLRLSEQVNDLRRQVHTLQQHVDAVASKEESPTSPEAPLHSSQKHGGVESYLMAQEAAGTLSEGTALFHAKELIQEQRESLLAFEQQLQKKEKMTTLGADAKSLSTVVREENAAVKERIRSLSSMMDREIQMYKSIAENAAQASQLGSSGKPPSSAPAHGRRAGSTNNTPGRLSTPGGDSTSNVGSQPNTAMQDDAYLQLKNQYAELKRAYNSQQSQLLKAQQK